MAERTLSEDAICKMLKSAASLANSVAPECHGDSYHKLQCAMAAKHLVEAAVMLKHAEINACSPAIREHIHRLETAGSNADPVLENAQLRENIDCLQAKVLELQGGAAEDSTQPRFFLEPAPAFPCIKRTGVDTFVVENRLYFAFEKQGQELRALVPGEMVNELTEDLRLPKDTLWAVFFGAARLHPHADVVEYLKRKVAERENGQ